MDYRRLNALTIKDKFPLPVIDEFMDELSCAQWFTSLDMRSGFHQVRMNPTDQYKTTFQTHHGHFEYKVMLYGLTRGPATFQKVMNNVLAPLLRVCVVVFIYDILIYSKTWQDHLDQVAAVFKLLYHHQFKVKLSKCKFAKQELPYLGHIISKHGVATDLGNVKIIQNLPVP